MIKERIVDNFREMFDEDLNVEDQQEVNNVIDI